MTNASHAADAIGVLLIVIVSVSIEREGLTLMEFQLSMDNFQDPQTNIAVVLTQTMPDEPVWGKLVGNVCARAIIPIASQYLAIDCRNDLPLPSRPSNYVRVSS